MSRAQPELGKNGDLKNMIDYNTRLLYMMKVVGALSMRYRFRMKDTVDGDILHARASSTGVQLSSSR